MGLVKRGLCKVPLDLLLLLGVFHWDKNPILVLLQQPFLHQLIEHTVGSILPLLKLRVVLDLQL